MPTLTSPVARELADNMRQWQKIENSAIVSTGRVMERTENPLVHLAAEIIHRDSMMHHRTQQFIIESLESQAVSLMPDELARVWDLVEKHIRIEMQALDLAEETLKSLKGHQNMLVQTFLLEYLREDEAKHNRMLDRLDDIKRGIYRSV